MQLCSASTFCSPQLAIMTLSIKLKKQCGFLDGPSLINAGHKLSCACVDIPEQWMMHTKEYGIFCPLYFLFYTRAKTWKGGDV